MFGIPDSVLFVILNMVVVGIFAYIVSRNKKSVQTKTQEEVASEKILHRCPHCNKTFEKPWKEIVYVTEPPTEKLICPFCQKLLRVEKEGKPKVGFPEILSANVAGVPAKTHRYDLVVTKESLTEVMDLLKRKGLAAIPMVNEDECHILVTSDRELSFAKLQQTGKVLRWTKVVQEGKG